MPFLLLLLFSVFCSWLSSYFRFLLKKAVGIALVNDFTAAGPLWLRVK